MNPALWFVLLAALIVCFAAGAVRGSYGLRLRGEIKGRHFGATCDGRDPFRVPVAEILAGGCRPTRLVCRVMKVPERQDLVYLIAGEGRTCALVTRVKVLNTAREDGSVDVDLKLYGARELPPDCHLFLTNIREVSRTISGDPAELSWPVVAARRRSSLLPLALIALLGLGGFALGLGGLLLGSGAQTGVFLVTGALMAAGGLASLIQAVRFRVTVTREGQIEIRRGFSTGEYQLTDLTGTIGTEPAGGGKVLQVKHQNKVLGALRENDPGFGDLLAVFRLAAEERGRDRLLEVLREVGDDLYVPLLQAPGRSSTVGQLLYRRDGARAYAAYESMELMQQELSKQNQAGDSCMGINTSLKELAAATNQFELAQIILVFIRKREGLPAAIPVTKDLWELLNRPDRKKQ